MLSSIGASPAVVHGVAFAVAFAIISFLHIVLGELAPKSLAIRKPEVVSLWTAVPLYLFYWLTYPFIWLLNGSANLILKIFGVDLAREGESAYSHDELKALFRASHLHGELGRTESEILRHGLDLHDLTVGDVMQPLAELVAIDVDAPFGETLELIRSGEYSRYPAYSGSPHELVGLLHIKDLFVASERLRDIQDVRPYLRELPIAPDDRPLLKQLQMFRTGAPHMAAAADDYGTIIGFVTLERVLETLVGPIDDEFRKHEFGWRRRDDGSVVGPASLSIVSLESVLGIAIDSPEANSVGGLVLDRLERLPQSGERVDFDRFCVEILGMSGPKIESVRVLPKASAGP
jgi:CBS domain containing-hemolysin-like protein